MKTFPLLLLTICIFQACIQSTKPPKFPDLPYLPKQKDHQNLYKFEDVVNTFHDTLGKKYHIKEYPFDVECIYAKEDLSKLVWEMIGLGSFNPVLVKDGHDKLKKEYFSLFKIGDSTYEFRTSSEGDYVNMETVFPGLEKITKDNKPEYQYNYSNRDGGQVAYMIFAKTTDLIKAVDEGYPCSLPSGEWKWDKEWKWGVTSEIELDQLPDYNDLKLKYFQTLQDLYSKGYNVPVLTINRIYIDDIMNENSIDIVIDGSPFPTSSNNIKGRKVSCFWESWGVLLAYTLIKHYNGKPSLYDKTAKKTTTLTQQEYLARAETAFGMRK
ncbi:MAG TPA: hypothetical protein VIM79_02415 [Niastella sp.]